MHTNTCCGASLYFVGTQTGICINRLWQRAGWPFFCGPTQEPALATANTRKTRESFWRKNEDEWNRKVEFRTEEIPGSRRNWYRNASKYLKKIWNRVHRQRSEKRSKTHKRLKERFLIRRNRTKRANFRGNPLFQATYNNNKTEKQTMNSTYLVSVERWRLAEGKGYETDSRQ